MKTIKPTLIFFFLLILCVNHFLFYFVAGGFFWALFFCAFLLLLLLLFVASRSSTKIRFTINSQFILLAFVIYALLVLGVPRVLGWLPNFEDPVSEQQACVMAAHWLKSTGAKSSPGYVFMRKGYDAGDIGYYVFDLNTENKGFLIVPADARFTSIYYKNNGMSYRDFYLSYAPIQSKMPQFSNTPLLKLKSLANKILSRKSKEQRAWSEVLRKRNEGDEGEVLK